MMNRHLSLFLLGTFALALSGSIAKADTFFVWDSSNGFAGTDVINPGGPSTWSGTFKIDTSITSNNEAAPPPITSLVFVGVVPPTNFNIFFATCNSTATCLTSQGFQNFSAAPVGTNFELMMTNG